MKFITVKPSIESLPQLIDLLEDYFQDAGAGCGVVIKLSIAVDEIFSNIAKYSKATMVKVSCSCEEAAIIEFEDDGIEYDQTKSPAPDVTLALEERKIGGLGIYMVKNMMDEFSYERVENKNRLIIKKYLDESQRT